jgi:hypothetical protein
MDGDDDDDDEEEEEEEEEEETTPVKASGLRHRKRRFTTKGHLPTTPARS